MKIRDVVLTGILFILIGVMIGMILTIRQFNSSGSDLAEVNIVELTKSSEPVGISDELKMTDSKYLFEDIAREVKPMVVFIETTIPVRRQRRVDGEGAEQDDGLLDRWLRPRRVGSVGSGVIISSEGYILTNNHVIEDAVDDGINVQLNDKRFYTARVVGSDPSTDLAVIKIDAKNLAPMVIGNSEALNVGEWVLAVGNPFNLQSTVTAGIVSAVNRKVSVIDANIQTRIESFIQTDAAINRGNSGGALINTSGELVGINTAIATQNGDYQGYGFAVPSNLALKIAGDIIQHGEVRRGFLGVSIRDVTGEIANETGMDRIVGALILEAEEGLAASLSDIRSGDIILEVDGSEIMEMNDLQVKVAMYHPGDEVSLTVWRDGESFERLVTLGGTVSANEEIGIPNIEESESEEEYESQME